MDNTETPETLGTQGEDKENITQQQKTKIITRNPPNTVGEPRYSQTVNSYCFVLWKTDFHLSNGIYVDIMKLYLYL